MDLTQGAARLKNMKHLMTLSHKIAPPWEAALQQREGEEEGAAEKERHLAKVINKGRVIASCRP